MNSNHNLGSIEEKQNLTVSFTILCNWKRPFIFFSRLWSCGPVQQWKWRTCSNGGRPGGIQSDRNTKISETRRAKTLPSGPVYGTWRTAGLLSRSECDLETSRRHHPLRKVGFSTKAELFDSHCDVFGWTKRFELLFSVHCMWIYSKNRLLNKKAW